jgi:Holliday junction resolvase RusA-like endonuclease
MTKGGRVYTPAATTAHEDAIAAEWARHFPDETIKGPVEVHIEYDKDGIHVEIHRLSPELKSSLRGDIDNYLKATLDGLNGVAYADDKQVYRISARKA